MRDVSIRGALRAETAKDLYGSTALRFETGRDLRESSPKVPSSDLKMLSKSWNSTQPPGFKLL